MQAETLSPLKPDIVQLLDCRAYSLPTAAESLSTPLSDDLIFNWHIHAMENPPTVNVERLAWDLRRRCGDERGHELFVPLVDQWGDVDSLDAVWAACDRPEAEDDQHLMHEMVCLHHRGQMMSLLHADDCESVRDELESLADRFDSLQFEAIREAFEPCRNDTGALLEPIREGFKLHEQAQFARDIKAGKMPLPASSNVASSPGVGPTQAPAIHSAASLKQKIFSPINYTVPGYIAEGCTILAGRPKVGKSWFMLDVGLAVASGGPVLGTKAEQGDVLYLGLEDNERRLKSRIGKVIGPFVEWPERFQYATEWSRADEGGLDQIRAWLKTVALPRLIVVDVLARFRSPHGRSTAQYDADYAAIQGLQAIASEARVAVVIVHHLRKSAADSDPFDKVSGTLGLSGAADTVLILDRDGQGTVLYGRGRDIEEIETAVKFNPVRCRWEALGSAQDVRQSGERKAIITALGEAGEPMSPVYIAKAVHRDRNSVDQLLFKMVRDGELNKNGRGSYALPTHKIDKIVSPSQHITVPPLPPLPSQR